MPACNKVSIGFLLLSVDQLVCTMTFFFQTEFTSIQLCPLYMEMHTKEQLLASIGLLAYKVDSLQNANAPLKNYGPKPFHGDRISEKRHHISSLSFQTRMFMSAECRVSLVL